MFYRLLLSGSSSKISDIMHNNKISIYTGFTFNKKIVHKHSFKASKIFEKSEAQFDFETPLHIFATFFFLSAIDAN